MKTNIQRKHLILAGLFVFFIIVFLFGMGFIGNAGMTYKNGEKQMEEVKEISPISETTSVLPLDKVLYDLKLKELANNPVPKIIEPKIDPKTGQPIPVPVVVPKPTLWPKKTIYPNDGAILPFKRIIAYYGNLYSKQMGVLGEYPEDIMLAKLTEQVKKWETADPTTPVQPALHYIAVVAQGSAGKDGKYRARMPDSEIDKVIEMAKKIDAIVFLDIQVGFSNLQTEVPLLEKYLKMPQVHLGVDPEFSMKTGIRPGKVVGTLDASDINFTTEYLAKVVKENNLTPKVLIIHRYTQKMFTNYSQVKIVPEVQMVLHMDGWGGKAKKIGTYNQFVYKEPIQFTGFKIFYKTDVREAGTTIFTPEELLKLTPRPIYIQYQ